MRSLAPFAGALTILVLVAVASCERQEEERVVEPLTQEEISGGRLWQRITEETDYQNYGHWPGHEGFQPGQAPHGPFHRVYVNRALLSALPISDKTAPNGSVIVKENHTADRDLTGFTVMAKVEGFAPESGNWFWAKYGPDGTIQAEGAVDSCITCHGGLKQNDYVIIHPLDQQPE